MKEEDKILVNAIGSVLDSNESPVQLSELVSMLNGGYLEAIGEESIDTVTEENVAECVNQNNELFDEYFGVISIKNQNYYSIDEIENELKEYLNKRQSSTQIDLVLFFLLFHRYAAVQDYFDLKELPTGQLIFRTYKEPERLDCSVITNLINQYSEIYGGESCKGDFRFDNEELISQRLTKLAKIVRRIDWRVNKLSVKLFDELISNLKIYYRFNDRSGELLTPKFSQFILGLIDFQDVSKIAELNSNLLESINRESVKIGKGTEIEINFDQVPKAIQSSLRVALMGYPNIKMDCRIISAQKKNDCDIVISFPPFGNLQKSFWAKKFSNTTVEISSLEELYTRFVIQRLSEEGKAYLILPENFLSGNRKSVSNLRKDLTEKGWIDTVIKLPRSWILPQTAKSINLVILNLKGVDSVYFFDMAEYQKQNQGKVKDTFNSASELIRERIPVQNVARIVNYSSILEPNYNLSVHKYINPVHFADEYKRSGSEKIIRLSETTQRIRPERHKVTNKYPFINMAKLADDPSNFVLDVKSAPQKKKYSSKRPLLKEDALLIGTIGGVLKPTIFQYRGTPIYLGSNVIALRVDKNEVDMEYLVSELNSKFVADQIRKLPTGTTIPHVKKTDLLNIAIRVPNRGEQTAIFNEWISSIAKEKIKEIEKLHESIKYIEKDVFSSFAHDFGKLQLKVSSSIDAIESYLKLLDEKEIISVEDSVFGEEKPDEGERVKDVIHRLRESHHRSVEFLKSEVKSLTQDLQINETIQLGELIEKWCRSQNTEHFNFELTEGLFGNRTNEINNKKIFENGYLIKGNETDIYKILDNMLDNAIKYGFGPNKRENRFRIHLENWITDEKNLVIVNMSVGNTGRPFPGDFSCEDFFKRRHRGPESKGEGLGGYSIKRAADNLGASISCETKVLSKKEYPVQFNIEFEPYNYDE